MPRLLGIDYGARRIGIALADEAVRVAVGVAIWTQLGTETIHRLKELIKEEDIERVIVGYPLTLRGEIGPKAREVDVFIEKLEAAGIPVERWDERFTTHQASHDAREAGLSERKQRGRLDMSAAVIMLQSYLDAHP
ncbi:Holliday junction resolvase RuvX [bacterium]|nr:Holliday junction resolvase RuvX [bacterium]